MRVPVQTKAVEGIGHQDQERQPFGLSNMLGTGSAAVAVGNVPGRRPAGGKEPKAGLELLPSRIDRSAVNKSNWSIGR